MNENKPDKLIMRVSENGIGDFINLLQSGVEVEATTKDSVLDTIERLEGFSTEYIEEEVQTIFLDGTPVDDITVPLSAENKVIALSAAMPGLSGAIYRRNSIHASLRSVQQSARNSDERGVPVKLSLKLFNAIARDRGPGILRQGFTLKGSKLISFLNSREWLTSKIHAVSFNGENVQSADLPEMLPAEKNVHLQLDIDT